MSWELAPGEIEALDWALELDRRGHASTIPDAMRRAVEWGDLAGMCGQLGYDGAPGVEGGRSSGLVSIPTTQKRAAPTPMPFRTRADVQALRQAVGAFEPDRDASRIARLRMNVGVSARCHVAEQGATDRCVMVTLTYAGDNAAWCPSHVRTFMDHVRKWCGRQGTDCRYVWVAELQRRGVIHYHVALWLRAYLQMPKPDACGWWPHGMTRIETARAAVPYLLKYLSKGGSYGAFPKGARTFGVGGLAHMYRRTRRWLSLPTFVRERSGTLDDWRRAKGGGWTAPDGSHWVSEFARSLVGGAACLLRVATHPSEWRPDGPYDRWTPRGAPC